MVERETSKAVEREKERLEEEREQERAQMQDEKDAMKKEKVNFQLVSIKKYCVSTSFAYYEYLISPEL